MLASIEVVAKSSFTAIFPFSFIVYRPIRPIGNRNYQKDTTNKQSLLCSKKRANGPQKAPRLLGKSI